MRISNKTWDDLARQALAVRRRAYAPYSRFKVGAALLGGDPPQVIAGCNVENSSYGLTVCAERAAIGRAVAEGVKDFVALAIASHGDEPAPPCGMCLQTLLEFCEDLELLLVNTSGTRRRTRLSKLIPQPFRFPRAGRR